MRSESKQEREERGRLADDTVDGFPPHSDAAERGALGCVLLAADNGEDIQASQMVADLSAALFFSLTHREVFTAMRCLWLDQRVVTTTNVRQWLDDKGRMELAGGLMALASLPDATASPGHFEEHLTTLREKRWRRLIINETSRAARMARDEAVDPEALAYDIKAAFTGLVDSRASSVLPSARAWLDIKPDATAVADAILVGPGNWLTRGSGLLIVGPTGCGKSTLDATLAFSFALGREAVGFRPSRPLKSLVIQAEDDDLDLRDMAGGIVADLAPTDAERELMRGNVQVVTESVKTGTAFVALVAGLLEYHKPDLLHLNPLSTFFGDDLNDQRAVAGFFRNGLNPLLAQYRCALACVHHTAKPSKERDGWRDGAQAYAGSGSADLANWAREVVTLRQVAPGLYEMAATKRWRKLGWTDADGKPVGTRLIAHARDGSQVWRDATADTLADLGAIPYTAASLCRMVPEAGIDKAELCLAVADKFTVSTRTAANYVADAARLRRHTVNGATTRCALFTETRKPRREVYPEQPANRPVVWLTLTEEGKRLCKR